MILKIHITLLLAFLYNLYIGKKKIFFIAYMFIIMHELSHMIMALILNVDIEEITLLPFGVNAKYSGRINMLNEFLIAIIGPIATLFFAFVYQNDTYFKINFLILLFNLIPIYPLDGGRIIRVFFVRVLGQKLGNKLNKLLNHFFMSVLIFFAIYMLIKYKNISFLLLSIYVWRIYREEIQKDKLQSIINYLQMNQ